MLVGHLSYGKKVVSKLTQMDSGQLNGIPVEICIAKILAAIKRKKNKF